MVGKLPTCFENFGLRGQMNFSMSKIFIVNQFIAKACRKIDPFFLGTSNDLKVPLHSFKSRACARPAENKHSVPLG